MSEHEMNILYVYHNDEAVHATYREFRALFELEDLTEEQTERFSALSEQLDERLEAMVDGTNCKKKNVDYDGVYPLVTGGLYMSDHFENDSLEVDQFFSKVEQFVAEGKVRSAIEIYLDRKDARGYKYVTIWNQY